MKKNELVIQILNYIDLNIFSLSSIDELAHIFHYNKDYIMRVFKKELNITIIEYIQNKKIYLSLPLLENSFDSILKISLLAGFNSQEYYCEIFKKVIGVSPNLYRKFIFHDKNISFDVIYDIQNHIISLKNLINRINNYSIVIEPKSKLSLSLFS